MICDAEDFSSERDTRGSVLIVGSGPVGLSIARRLSELGMAAVVLEAGRNVPGDAERDSLKAEFESQSLPGVTLGRTRQLGGGLNLWGGQLAKFEADELSAAGPHDAIWPVDSNQSATSIEIASRLLGQPGWPKKVPAPIAAMQEGLARYGLHAVATTWLKAPKWTRSVWDDLGRSPHIQVVLGIAVEGIHFDVARNRVLGVMTRTLGGARRIVYGSSVIIAGGTIESVRILLQPDAIGAPQPWHRLPWLGRGFCEHLDAPVATLAVHNPRPIVDFFDPVYSDGIKTTWKVFGQVQLDGGASASGVLMLDLPGNLRNAASELRMLVRGLTPRLAVGRASDLFRAGVGSVREVGPLAWRYFRHRRLWTNLRGNAVIRASIEQPVRWESRIALSDDRDRFGVRRTRIDWRTGKEEGQTFRDLAKRVCAWLEAAGAGQASVAEDLVRDPEGFARRAHDGLHHAGGTRMGRSPVTSVVDVNLQVHGVPGLYVCSASVFPRPGFANPTLTTVALGARLASHLMSGSTQGEK